MKGRERIIEEGAKEEGKEGQVEGERRRAEGAEGREVGRAEGFSRGERGKGERPCMGGRRAG